MKLVFFWNYLNHHQVLIADALYELLGDDFCFVATLPRNVKELKGGKDYSNNPYCILAGENNEMHDKALMLAKEADVCVFGACSQEFVIVRAKSNPKGLAFECGERWLKKGVLNVLSPVLRQWWINYMRYYRKANFYKLCSSAFASHDDQMLGCYRGRHFKWAYFTEVSKLKEDDVKIEHRNNSPVRLMWCSRFIDWKHPELAIECAKRLKEDGYKFTLDTYGDGELLIKMKSLVDRHNLRDVVFFHGSVPNAEIQQAMRDSDIFLFTSDKQEGWGAVANESMAAKCCLVGSDEIGAVPFLVRDSYNGIIFKSRSVDSLYERVKYLLENPNSRNSFAEQGYKDMVYYWSPQIAAKNLMILIENLQNGKETIITSGPCSRA